MRLLTLVFALLAPALHSVAQTPDCTPGRYYDVLFDVDITSGIQYGQAAQPTLLNPNATQTLYLDVYQPEGDAEPLRPLVVWAFGGGFTVGSRLSPDIVDLCNRQARTGYVCASIDYRLSTDLLLNATEEKLYTAVMKAAHDMRAALRFFWQSARTGGNPWRIDTNRIFIGGVSAGAITALHLAYLDDAAEIPAAAAAMAAANNGLEGNSGNPGFPSRVAGVLSLSGALGDTVWIETPADAPLCALHGTEDAVVPYASGGTSLFPGVALTLHGGLSLAQRAASVGLPHVFRPYPNEGHTPFILGTNTAANMDTTYWTIRDFLLPLACAGAVGGGEADSAGGHQFTIYPNPAANVLNLKVEGLTSGETFRVTFRDMMGREVSGGDHNCTENPCALGITHLPTGLYLVNVEAAGHPSETIRITVQR